MASDDDNDDVEEEQEEDEEDEEEEEGEEGGEGGEEKLSSFIGDFGDGEYEDEQVVEEGESDSVKDREQQVLSTREKKKLKVCSSTSWWGVFYNVFMYALMDSTSRLYLYLI